MVNRGADERQESVVRQSGLSHLQLIANQSLKARAIFNRVLTRTKDLECAAERSGDGALDWRDRVSLDKNQSGVAPDESGLPPHSKINPLSRHFHRAGQPRIVHLSTRAVRTSTCAVHANTCAVQTSTCVMRLGARVVQTSTCAVHTSTRVAHTSICAVHTSTRAVHMSSYAVQVSACTAQAGSDRPLERASIQISNR